MKLELTFFRGIVRFQLLQKPCGSHDCWLWFQSTEVDYLYYIVYDILICLREKSLLCVDMASDNICSLKLSRLLQKKMILLYGVGESSLFPFIKQQYQARRISITCCRSSVPGILSVVLVDFTALI